MTTLIPKYDEGATGAVNRPFNQKLQETISVLDFGADPTGANDSTTAIQAAIDSISSPGASLYFPRGTYKITGLGDASESTDTDAVNVKQALNLARTQMLMLGGM